MNPNVVPIILTLISFSFFSYANYKVILKINTNKILNILISLTVSPLLISLFLYILIRYFPGKEDIFYTSFINFSIFIYSFFIFNLIKNNQKQQIKIINTRLDLKTKIFLIIVAAIYSLSFIRAIFWPIYWDDQILYVKQAYSIAKSKDIKIYNKSQVYTDENVNYTINQSIRPGLIFLYAYCYLVYPSYDALPVSSQIVIIYFFTLLLLATAYIAAIFNKNKPDIKKGVFSLLLLTTCFYFVNFTIYGFKEVIICLLLLFSIELTLKIINENNYKYAAVLGILTGFMSYLNYSGTVIVAIVLFCLFIFSKFNIKKRILILFCVSIITFLFSGGEVLVFYQKFSGSVSSFFISSPKDQSIVLGNPKAANELKTYKIDDVVDLYVKGKFQGFSQYQNFGFIFAFFIITLIARFKYFVRGKKSKIFLIFIAIYSLIFLDIFSLNRDKLSYVLIVSPKYTLMLVPLISILISSHLNWYEKITRKLVPGHFLTIFIFLLPPFFFLWKNPEYAFNIIRYGIPMYRSSEYYIGVITSLLKILFILSFISAFIIGMGLTKNSKLFNRFWKKHSISLVSLIILIFVFPFSFVFNTNYSVNDIIFKSFYSKNEKLLLIKGAEQINKLVTQINSYPKNEKILMLSGYSNNTLYYIDKDPSKIVFAPKTKELSFREFVIKKNIRLVLAQPNAKFFDNTINTKKYLKIVGRGDNVYLYEVDKKMLAD